MTDLTIMQAALLLLIAQAVVGAFDNLWHHELTEVLRNRYNARAELALHTGREAIYGVLFFALAWYAWQGWWLAVPAVLMAAEIVITISDFLVEDRTRRLPGFERALHTLLAVNYGIFLGLFALGVRPWIQAETAIVPVDHGAISVVLTVLSAGVLAWAAYDAVNVWRMRRFARVVDNPCPPIHGGGRRVLITGGTGLIGQALTRALIAAGDEPLLYVRDVDKARHLFGRRVRLLTDFDALLPETRIDAVVNLAGEPIAAWPWTAKRRRVLPRSRNDLSFHLVAALARLRQPPEVLVSASAVGFYGDAGDDLVAEDAAAGQGFAAELCADWEQQALSARTLGTRVAIARFGLVFAEMGGILPMLRLAARFGAVAVMGSGRQWMPWVALDDAVAALRFALDNPAIDGSFNVVAPRPVRQAGFARLLGKAMGAPLRPRAPAWLLRHGMGEMADLFLAGQRLRPERLLAAGYRFARPTLAGVLRRHPHRERTALTVYYDRDCPICRAEIDGYACRIAPGAGIDFVDIADAEDRLRDLGIAPETARRRIHAVRGDGRIIVGADVFGRIWDAVPGYRWLAASLRHTAVRWLARALYDGLAVPALAAFNRWRLRHGTHAGLPQRRLHDI